MTDLTDETLVAYVDGELPAPDRAAVEAQIDRNPEAQNKVRMMRETAALLRAAFTEMDAATDYRRLKGQTSGAPGRRRAVQALAAAVALTAGTGLIGSVFMERGRFALMEDVAAYHSVYARETEHLVEVPASRKAELENWLGSRIGRRLDVPDLSTDGWTFEGGRLLAECGRPIAQLMYSAPRRHPIALCVTVSGQPESEPSIYHPRNGLHIVAWDDGGYLFIVVGDLAESEIAWLAREVRSHFHAA
jgi:anti-sigma factor RsiW